MKDDYSYWSENLHSAYLFYTLEVDKLNKENKRLREALKKINTSIINDFAFNDKPYISMINGLKNIAKQALGA